MGRTATEATWGAIKPTSKDAVIIGGGTSFMEHILNPQFSALCRGKWVIGVNAGADHYPCDTVFSIDRPWIFRYLKRSDDTRPARAILAVPQLPVDLCGEDIEFIRRIRKTVSTTADAVAGTNSGYAAINMALLAGCRNIFLAGFDMSKGSDGTSHWHGAYSTNRRGLYGPWIVEMEELANYARQNHQHIINLNPNSAITCFQKQTVEQACQWAVPCGLQSTDTSQ